MSLKSALGFLTESMLTETKGPSSGGPVAGCSLPQGPQPQESEWETVEARLSAIRVVALEEGEQSPTGSDNTHTYKQEHLSLFLLTY